jgi:hypothetical protein
VNTEPVRTGRRARLLSWGLVALFVLGFGLASRKAAASWLVNAGLVSLLKAPACDLGWFVCQRLPEIYPLMLWEGSQPILERVQGWLEQSLDMRQDSPSTLMRLAEVKFSLQARGEAAELARRAAPLDASQSPLLQADRYEARLIQAHQKTAEQAWEDAVYHYRLGLSWGDERVLEQDQADYLRALAAFYQAQTNPDQPDETKMYWIGRLLAEAGEGQAAEIWLDQLVGQNSLPVSQQARLQETLGRLAEQKDDQAAALTAYQKAVELDPGLRSAGIRLLGHLRQAGKLEQADELELSLSQSGPAYYLGEQGDGYLVQEVVSLAGGWTLEGYNLDEEMLEQAHFLDLWLWWKKEGEAPQGEEWIRVGDWWVEMQRVTNLFPNAGFEWGVDERGVPLGHDREFYRAPEGSLYVTTQGKDEKQTNVLVTHNTPEINHVALASRMMVVDPNAKYLMAGLIWDSIGLSTIGRGCKGQGFSAPSPYYIAVYVPDRPLNEWVNHAELSEPHPGLTPELCESLVMNDDSANKPAYWDNILLARIYRNK